MLMVAFMINDIQDYHWLVSIGIVSLVSFAQFFCFSQDLSSHDNPSAPVKCKWWQKICLNIQLFANANRPSIIRIFFWIHSCLLKSNLVIEEIDILFSISFFISKKFIFYFNYFMKVFVPYIKINNNGVVNVDIWSLTDKWFALWFLPAKIYLCI